jgi:anhydro-N-acetylmuramic acid kinase
VNQQNNSYKVLGLMSGTSLDGLDLCLAEFKEINSRWTYEILASETRKYSSDWEMSLRNVENKSAAALMELDFSYGKLIGTFSLEFLQKHRLTADFISSHGHTIFHQIENGFTYQIGHGAAISATTGLACICDFRSLDVALGGQGAPLVPFGDHHLFRTYTACINLGGIANFSFERNDERLAHDICAFNMVLNHFMQKYLNKEFDKDGTLSRSGRLNAPLFESLNNLAFFSTKGPKSLGKEWVFLELIPLIEGSPIPLADKLCSFSHHAAEQISKTLLANNFDKELLFTGGGSKNIFFMELLRSNGLSFQLPKEELIDFKEALVFAFLGLNRFLCRNNTFKTATGATKDSCGGSIYLP